MRTQSFPVRKALTYKNIVKLDLLSTCYGCYRLWARPCYLSEAWSGLHESHRQRFHPQLSLAIWHHSQSSNIIMQQAPGD